MPADLDYRADGTARIAVARTAAWHRMGVLVPDAMTAREALTLAGLDNWNITKQPLTTVGPDGTPLVVPGRVATVRYSEGVASVLGVVGEDYTVIQNEVAFAFADALLDVGGAHYESAGALAGVRRVFMSLSLPGGLTVAGEDPHNLLLSIITGHDGSMALTSLVSPVRTLCANTVTLALSTAKMMHKVWHTGSTEGKVAEARQALQLAYNYRDAFTVEMEKLLDQEMSSTAFEEFVESQLMPLEADASKAMVTRTEKARASLLQNYAGSATIPDTIRPTRYGALQAITEWQEWIKPSDVDAGAVSTLLGAGANARQRAFDLLTS